MAQQTAVEWLIDKIAEKSIMEKDRYYIPYNSGTIDITDLIEQAKKMEKEQIIEAYKRESAFMKHVGCTDEMIDKSSIKYYNETYKK